MWEEDELPEGDLESVYGRDALHRWRVAVLDRLYANQVAGIARLKVLGQRQDEDLARLDRLLHRPEESR